MSLLLHHGWREREICAGGELIVVGLVNNMPDRGLQTVERQFRQLLSGVPDNLRVRLRIFTLPEIARSPDEQLYIVGRYDSIDALWTSDLGDLIVSGTEPRAVSLADEPYWPTLTRVVEWAEARTISTVWSCLAAPAAVYHLDGIEQRVFPETLSGVFGCELLGYHPLFEGLPSRWRVPHSRCNEIAANITDRLRVFRRRACAHRQVALLAEFSRQQCWRVRLHPGPMLPQDTSKRPFHNVTIRARRHH